MTPKEEQKHTDLLPLKYDGKRIIDAKGRTVGDMRTVAGKELSQAMVDAMNTRNSDCHEELDTWVFWIEPDETIAIGPKNKPEVWLGIDDKLAASLICSAHNDALARATNHRESGEKK